MMKTTAFSADAFLISTITFIFIKTLIPARALKPDHLRKSQARVTLPTGIKSSYHKLVTSFFSGQIQNSLVNKHTE